MNVKLFNRNRWHNSRDVVIHKPDAGNVELEVILPNHDVVLVSINDGSAYGPGSGPTVQVAVRAHDQTDGRWVYWQRIADAIAGKPVGSGYSDLAGAIGWEVHPDNPKFQKSDSVALGGK